MSAAEAVRGLRTRKQLREGHFVEYHPQDQDQPLSRESRHEELTE
jgi:hypothetical protein